MSLPISHPQLPPLYFSSTDAHIPQHTNGWTNIREPVLTWFSNAATCFFPVRPATQDNDTQWKRVKTKCTIAEQVWLIHQVKNEGHSCLQLCPRCSRADEYDHSTLKYTTFFNLARLLAWGTWKEQGTERPISLSCTLDINPISQVLH